jgi:D-alanyl-D-alanine carboxypeptidase
MYTRTLPLLAACVLTASCMPAPVGTPAPRVDAPVVAPELLVAIDSIARSVVEAGEVAGISVAVSSGGRPIHTGSYGLAVVEDDTPLADGAVFRIGSIAKQFTAAAVLRLAEEGRLSLEDPLSRHLSDLPPHWQAVTVHQLLTHTSGIPSYTDLREFWDRATEVLPVQERIGMVRDLPLAFEPGTRWAYNNTGYLLLGLIIERLSGLTYGEYVEQELVAPLDLRETGACSEQDARLVRGYRRGPGGFVPARSNQIGGPFADGDLCSSARDLLRWTTALGDGRVVRPGSYRRMITRGRLLDGQEIHYGYGFDLMHLEGVGPVVEHGGGVPGFIGHLAHYPEQDVTIAVLTNTFEPAAQKAKQAIERRLFASLLPAVLDMELPPERIATYAGTYELYLPAANLGPFPARIFGSGGRLMAELEGTEIPLLWQGGHVFIDGSGHGLRHTFEVIDGRAVKLVVQRSGLDFEGDRAEAACGHPAGCQAVPRQR